MTKVKQSRTTTEWAAWLARPIAEREAIQDKVRAAMQADGIQAGRNMMKANAMPTPPAALVIPADVLEARRETEDADEFDDEPWEPTGRVGRVDH